MDLKGLQGGFFVVIEGPDGSGKTSVINQLRRMVEKNTEHTVTFTREPGGTGIGAELRKILLSPESKVAPTAELLLMMADRVQHLHEVVLPALKAGHVVICDRYYPSTYAYQGSGRGYTDSFLDYLQQSIGVIEPDLLVILDVDAVEGLQRNKKHHAKAGEMRFENEGNSFHDKVRAGYAERYHITEKDSAWIVTGKGDVIHRRHPDRVKFEIRRFADGASRTPGLVVLTNRDGFFGDTCEAVHHAIFGMINFLVSESALNPCALAPVEDVSDAYKALVANNELAFESQHSAYRCVTGCRRA